MPTTLTIPSEEEINRLSARDSAIYDQTLKAILEREYNGQEVAIHLETGDYAVAKNSPDARRASRPATGRPNHDDEYRSSQDGWDDFADAWQPTPFGRKQRTTAPVMT